MEISELYVTFDINKALDALKKVSENIFQPPG